MYAKHLEMNIFYGYIAGLNKYNTFYNLKAGWRFWLLA